MGKHDYEKSYTRQIEAIVIIVSGIYQFTELALGYRNGWNSWGQALVFGTMIVSWIFFFGKYKSYDYRAMLTSFVSQFTVIVYAIEIHDFYTILSVFISLCILLGMYGKPKAMIFPFVSYHIILFYYIFIDKSLGWGTYSSDLGMVTRVLQGYLVLFMVFYLIYRYKTSNDSMLEMIDALRKSEREKDDFLANVSHEIRTPVNTICGVSEIMLKNGVPEELKEDVLSIQSAGRSLVSVIGDILDYSELQEGEFELVEENYYITSTIHDVINMTMAKKSEKNIELIVDIDSSMPSVLIGDEQKIRRIIMNLVNNAVEFTNEGCISLCFETRREEYGVNLMITIKDTGIGMTKESVENLFKKFSQADMGRTRKKGGVGLGLAIAQALVTKMGGFITVKSELDRGSEFKVIIPQKVYEDAPIIHLSDTEKVKGIVYINMEQFRYGSIRDEYTSIINRTIKQLKVNCHITRNLAEFKRWERRESYNQVFISLIEYQEDMVYFDALAKHTNVHVILDKHDDSKVQNKNIKKIYKPFSILSVVTALKDSLQQMDERRIEEESHKLYAPDAHVLVIDDNRMNIRVVEGLLKEFGIKVSYALSGQEGIDKLQSMEYDLILLDHMMPGMDGIECFHHIRKKQGMYYKALPIVALTANAIAGAREMFMKEGFTDFLAKPVESSVLQRVLQRHLPEKKQLTALDKAITQNDYKDAIEAAVRSKEPEKVEKQLVVGDLDVEKGITYCGNQNNYLEILASQRDSGPELKEQVLKLYDTGDWKNYTIIVHGIKSAMMSIGAVVLSEKAKALEMAGKADNVEFIKDNHADMMQEFDRVQKILETCTLLRPMEVQAKTATKPAVSEEQFNEWLIELENASYDLDGEMMKAILNKMLDYSYGGVDLSAELTPVYKKIEMFDLMSAYEHVAKIKAKRD